MNARTRPFATAAEHEASRAAWLALVYGADQCAVIEDEADEGHARSCPMCHDPIRGDWPDDLCGWCRPAIDAENEADAAYEASL